MAAKLHSPRIASNKPIHMLQDDKSMTNLQVYKSNDLMAASYRLSVPESRVILTCIAKINRDPTMTVTDQEMYQVTAREFAELCGISMKAAYSELKQAIDQLFERKIRFNMAERSRKTRWIQTADYLSKEGRIELRFSKDVLPYLVGLQNSYTKYNLRAVARLSTFSSIRLYELIVKHRFTGRPTALLPLESIRFAMEISDDQYQAYADLRKRVIEPAIKEINKQSDVYISTFRPKRDGKRIVAIEVHYTDKPDFGIDQVQEDLLDDEVKAPAVKRPSASKKASVTEAEIREAARPGESRSQVVARLMASRKALVGELV